MRVYIRAIWLQGVESERCPGFSRSMEAGRPVFTGAESTLADGEFECEQHVRRVRDRGGESLGFC